MSMGGGDDTTLAKNSGADSGAGVNINIRCSSGSKFSLQVNLDSTVGSFKSKLIEHANVPVEQQRLIYKGRILKDDQTLQSYVERRNYSGNNKNKPSLVGSFMSILAQQANVPVEQQ
ncbi:Ubiquitin domain-containing protein DSK2b [Capsicum chinense]|nr:Ubiquitin domain-containing protein DSK2b [Capsicum chinense]